MYLKNINKSMKNLNSYIFEKFKINKDTLAKSRERLFEKGEPIYRISYTAYPSYNTYKITLNANDNPVLLKFAEIKNDRIYFISNATGLTTCFGDENDLKINSNGFYEVSGAEYKKVIYLNYRDAIDILENIFLNFSDNKEKLKDYFDKDDEINYKNLYLAKTLTFIKNSITELKKYKEEHEKS